MYDEKAAKDTGSAGPMMQTASRQSARGVLNNKIKRAEERLNSLVTLYKTIPWDLLREEDEESLWRYFSRTNH